MPRWLAALSPLRLVRVLLSGVLLIALAISAGVGWILWQGVRVEADALRGRLERLIAEQVGRPVTIETLDLHLHRRPTMSLRGVRIGNPPGFSDTSLLDIGTLRASIDPMAWWRERRLHIGDAALEDLRIVLEYRADGTANWTPAARVTPGAATTETGGTTATPSRPIDRLAIDRLVVDRLTLDYRDARANRPGNELRAHRIELDRLEASAPAAAASRLSLSGRVDGAHAYRLSLDAGPLDDLLGGGQRWPLALEAAFLGSNLSLDGMLVRQAEGLQGEFDVGLGAADLREIEQLLGTRLPPVGVSALAGRLTLAPGGAAIRDLIGTVGASTLSGTLGVTWTGPRPLIEGELTMPNFDARPFLSAQAKTPAHTPPTLARWYAQIVDDEIDPRLLRQVDASLSLSVGAWLHLPGEVRDASLAIDLREGRLRAPMRVTLAGVALDGQIDIDAAAATPRFELVLGVVDSPLGDLARLLFGLPGVRGRVGGFAMSVNAGGDTGAALIRSADTRVVIARGDLSYGNEAGQRPVSFVLDSLALTIPIAGSMNAQASGRLLDEPLSVAIDGPPLDTLLRGHATLRTTMRSRSLRLSAEANIEHAGDTPRTSARFLMTADNAGDAARWFRLHPGVALPMRIEGQASWRPGEWSLKQTVVQLGGSRLHADFSQNLPPGGARARLEAAVVAEVLDIDQLRRLMGTPRGSTARAPDRPLLDIPILPTRIDLSDTDMRLEVRQVLGTPAEIGELSLQARMRDGRMLASPFDMRALGVRFSGAIAMDLRGQAPEGELWLGAESVDIGDILGRLKLASTVRARADAVQLHLNARGSQLGDLLERSELTAQLDGGSLSFGPRAAARDGPGRGEGITLTRGTIHAAPGAPLTARLEGAYQGEPVSLELRSAKPTDLVRTDRHVPFDLDVAIEGAMARVNGSIRRPVAGREIELTLTLEGDRFDRFDHFARASLPPWGPFNVDGRLRLSPGGYDVSALRLRVGQSTLRGRGIWDLSQPTPRFDLNLSAPSIQLDDFPFDRWSPVAPAAADAARPLPPPGSREPPKPPGPPAASPGAGSGGESRYDALRAQAAAASDRAQSLLSPAVLRRQDGRLRVRVRQVAIGAERLGGGELLLTVADGQARLDPIEVEMPGGRASLVLEYAPDEREVRVTARARVDHFDYGLLARRVKPGSDLAGHFSLSMDLASRAPSLAQAMRHANGTLDVAVWPRNIRSDVFDLWAVNLFTALVSRVDPSSASKVNCAIGRFTFTDGVMRERLLALDATRVRVTGSGQADFRDETLDLHVRPQPKQAQFFSLATPIVVTGRFDAPEIGVAPGGVLETALRLGTSLLWVPLQKLLGKEVPEDGHDLCQTGIAAGAPEN